MHVIPKEPFMKAVAACLSCLVTVSALAAPAVPLPPAADLTAARALLRDLVDTRSTHAEGTSAAAHLLEQRFLAAGFARADVTFIAPAAYPQSGNLIVRVHGRGHGQPVLFLGHLDVVAANAADWSVDPFHFTEREGYFYGRGTIDMKDGDAALAESLLRLHAEGWVPDHDVIAAFTADEEAGGVANGPAFLLKEHRALIDAGMAFNLDGGGGALRHGDRSQYEVGTSEKTYVTFTAETTAPGGHGSLPGPDNPIYRLAKALSRVEAYRFPVMTTATTRGYFSAMADIDGGAKAADFRAVAKTPSDTAAAERMSESVLFNALLRTTCVATLMTGGHAENALPQRAKATIQCRMMPGDTAAQVEKTLRDVMQEPKITLSLDAEPIVSPESVPTPAIMNRISQVVHSMWPSVPVVPSMATGFSDDRQTRNAGIPSFDVSGVWMDEDENRAHGRDERVSVVGFDESVEYTYRLLKEMGTEPATR
jgi:acetylornithine deacetylase/succinyl-diaminopimelate desuccinylase-like protein